MADFLTRIKEEGMSKRHKREIQACLCVRDNKGCRQWYRVVQVPLYLGLNHPDL